MDTKEMSKKQEKYIAELFNGRTVIASGALWGSKGDARNEDYLIECKITGKKSFPIKKSVWDKINGEAIKDGLRLPLLIVTLENNILDKTFVVFNTNVFTSEDLRDNHINLNMAQSAEKVFTFKEMFITDEIPFKVFKFSEKSILAVTKIDTFLDIVEASMRSGGLI
jgi:hypothetical protein